jgi:hypothetical protein
MTVKTANMMPYWYVVPATASLAAAASSSNNISFDADSYFTWVKTTYFCDLSAAAMTDSTRPIPLINVTFTDTGSGRNFMSTVVPIDSIAGYKASEPYLMTRPKTFSPNATLRTTLTNYSSATTYTNIFLVLHGYKTFK